MLQSLEIEGYPRPPARLPPSLITNTLSSAYARTVPLLVLVLDELGFAAVATGGFAAADAITKG